MGDIIELERDGRPLYRYKYNFRTDPVTGRKVNDVKESRDRKVVEEFVKRLTPATSSRTDRITVYELVELWRAAHDPVNARARTKPWQLRTRNDRDQQARLRIYPFLGSDRVDQLLPTRVEDWIEWMLEPIPQTVNGKRVVKPRFGPRVANKALQDLKAAIRWGRGKGHCTNVMVDDVDGLAQTPPKEANPYPPSQVEQIANGCRHLRDATLVYVGAYSGLRWSELRALQWGDIDWTNEQIHVQRSIDADGSEKGTKGEKNRTVPVLDPGMRALREYRKALGGRPPKAQYVFRNQYGRVMMDWHRDHLPKIREACGISFDPHELRDTYASILIATEEISVEELTKWLAHSSVKTTLDRYARLFEARKKHVASKANALLATLG